MTISQKTLRKGGYLPHFRWDNKRVKHAQFDLS